jgi:hypothetical protein
LFSLSHARHRRVDRVARTISSASAIARESLIIVHRLKITKCCMATRSRVAFIHERFRSRHVRLASDKSERYISNRRARRDEISYREKR